MMNMKVFILLVVVNIAFVCSKPVGVIQAAGSLETVGIPPLISFDKGGNVGVNFGGYHASAGLGGLLTGDLARGGLHASAGTPTGQAAAAGLGGVVGGGGTARGGLFAGATAGGGVHSSSALYGTVGGETHVKGAGKGVVVAEKTVRGQPEVQRTIIEKTVIPNYVEKKVQETHYVEKTIRVPQTVEKTIRVPVAPTVIEKEIQVPKASGAAVEAGLDVRASPSVVAVAEKRVPATVGVVKYGSLGSGYSQGSSGNFYASGGVASGGYGKSQLFTDIFNIPISALGAVSNLLNGIAGAGHGHAHGSFAVNKHFSTY